MWAIPPTNDIFGCCAVREDALSGCFRPTGSTRKELPIPNAPDREAIAELVEKCLDAKGVGCEEWEAEIAERVAALYGL